MEFELGSADTDDVLAVRSLLDAALLDVERIESRIESGDVLIASADGRIVGVIVLDPAEDATHIAGIAVQRRRRGNGIGSALVRAATDRGRLTAEFDERVLPFYESLGFAIDPTGEDGRYWGVLDTA